MLDALTLETFEPIIGQTFTLTANEGQTYPFELTDVEALPVGRRSRRAPAPKRAPFSLFFVGEPLLPQAIYPMQHESFGGEPMEIFIVPVGEVQGRGYEYEAVFT